MRGNEYTQKEHWKSSLCDMVLSGHEVILKGMGDMEDNKLIVSHAAMYITDSLQDCRTHYQEVVGWLLLIKLMQYRSADLRQLLLALLLPIMLRSFP